MSSKSTNHNKGYFQKKLLRRVTQTIAENSMVQPGDSVLAAVSGGPDSVALIHILSELTSVFSFRLAVAHLNHDLRSHESDHDAEFVTSLARKLNLPFHADKKNVRRYQLRHRLSPEEAARQVRYGFFNQVAESHGYTKIAVGHQLDDNAELVMMFLLRGSGTLGLSGMPPIRDGKIIRPLLKIKRSEIIDYLAEQDLEYVSDTSNANVSYLRNKIRHELIPQLSTTYNPNIVAALNRLASLVRSEEKWMDGLIEPIFKSALISHSADSICMALDNFGDIPLAARRRLIRKAILKLNGTLRRITFAHVDAAVDLAMKGPDTGRIDLPNHLRIQRNQRSLIITKHKNPLRSRGPTVSRTMDEDYEYRIATPGITFIKEAQFRLKLTEIGIEEITDLHSTGQQIAFFDITKLKFPLVVRNFRPGDRFSPLGMPGTQKLKNFFINNKIPRGQRVNCPLLVSDGKIIWVAGHRLDNSVKVDAETRMVLKAELLLA
jgi:tRNA(Ile)-lysidine synthase